jgi:hypothetical protein
MESSIFGEERRGREELRKILDGGVEPLSEPSFFEILLPFFSSLQLNCMTLVYHIYNYIYNRDMVERNGEPDLFDLLSPLPLLLYPE